MADDKRRAEIKAIARDLRSVVRDAANTPAGRGDVFFDERAARILDRFCAARGDDESIPASVREYHAMLAGDVDFLRAQRAKARADIEAARSPQGEAHESGIEAALSSGHSEARAQREHKGHHGSPCWCVVERIIAAYLSRVSPSRDGTVAVEDGGQMPCPRCSGQGVEEVPARGSWEEHGTVYAECRKCGGTGAFSPASTSDQP